MLQCELRVNAHTRQAIDRRRILTVAGNRGRTDFEFFRQAFVGFDRVIILITRFLITMPAVLSLLPVIPLAAQVAGLVGGEEVSTATRLHQQPPLRPWQPPKRLPGKISIINPGTAFHSIPAARWQ